MAEFVATFTRTIYIPVRFEAANEAEAAKMVETMKLALEATEPSDVAVTKVQTAESYEEEWFEGLRETPIDPEPGLQ
jgi:hypothetical protein